MIKKIVLTSAVICQGLFAGGFEKYEWEDHAKYTMNSDMNGYQETIQFEMSGRTLINDDVSVGTTGNDVGLSIIPNAYGCMGIDLTIPPATHPGQYVPVPCGDVSLTNITQKYVNNKLIYAFNVTVASVEGSEVKRINGEFNVQYRYYMLYSMIKNVQTTTKGTAMHITQKFQEFTNGAINDQLDMTTLNPSMGLSVLVDDVTCTGWNRDLQQMVDVDCGEVIVENGASTKISASNQMILDFDVRVTGEDVLRIKFDYLAQMMYGGPFRLDCGN